jgi:U5 small nuclear ribonucleoprotein component
MADEEDLYDEFGNYIGPDLDSSDDDSSDDDEQPTSAPDDASDVSGDDHQPRGGVQATMMVVAGQDNNANTTVSASTADPMNAIVLHEDKEHYPSADQVYGEGVRTAVLDEDAMDLDTPLVEPIVTKSHLSKVNVVENDDWIYSDDYLTTVLVSNETTRTRRGIAVVGHLHHGKTCLLDTLLESTLRKPWGARAALEVNAGGGPRFTDILEAEQERQMSLVSTPLSALVNDTRGKTYCFTMLDCPGHPHFHDESVAALRAMDGAVVCVDSVEGIMMHTEMVVRQAVSEGLPIVLVITKVDRLIVELKLPPRDCYYKLLNLVESLNELIGQASRGRYPKLSPERGNVAFSSAQHGWLFTLKSFAQLYVDHKCDNSHGLGENLSVDDLATRLWGDCYLDPATRTFQKSPHDCSARVERTFVKFILEPLYKLYAACLGEREEDVNKLLRSLGVLLKKEQLRASARPLLRAALSKLFETASCGFVDMVVQHM